MDAEHSVLLVQSLLCEEIGVRVVLLALAFVPGLASAQSGWWPGFAKSIEKISVKKADGQLPAKNPKIGETFKLIHADKWEGRGDEVAARGHVHATYQGYEIFADAIRGSKTTRVFRLEGGGKLVGESETIVGEVIVIDFKSGNFAFEDGRATLKPDRLEKKTTGDLYIKAEGAAGNEFDFTAEKGRATFCDLDNPHFELNYDTARILPGKRAELRSVGLEILGKTVLKLPMIVVPLNRNAPKYLPEVGQSVDEGYYIKTRISTPVHGEDYIDTRIDLMSKLGAGLGLDYFYTNPNRNGKLSAYTLTGSQKSHVLSAQHQEKVGAGSLALSTNYQQSDYLTAPGSTLWNTNAMYQLPWAGGNSRLTFSQYSNKSAGFRSTNEVLGFADDHTIGGILSRFEASLNTSNSSFGTESTRSERVDLRYGASADARSFTADLVYQRSVPVGKSENFYSSSDITPMLSLRTSAQQLFSGKNARVVPFSLEASIGELVNPTSTDQNKVTRIFFDLGFRRSEKSGEKLTLDWGSRFKQGLYSDDTAQYILNYDGNLTYNFARDSSFSVNYGYLRGFGYTPLAIDSAGRNDAFAFNLDYKPSRTVTLSAQSGYDVFQSSVSEVPWQYVWLRSQWKPGDWMNLNASASYDTFNTAWSNLRLDSEFVVGSTRLNLGARYDGLRSQWAGFNVLVDGFRLGKVRTNLLLDYNGYTKQMDSQHYQFIYNLHCAEAVFEIIDNQVGFRAGRTFAFYFRIKAVPTNTGFGSGTRGQSIGGGYGFGD